LLSLILLIDRETRKGKREEKRKKREKGKEVTEEKRSFYSYYYKVLSFC